MTSPRVTELPNPVTVDIDVVPAEGVVRLLGTSDAQLFSGYGGLIGLCDEETISSVASLIRLCAQTLAHPRGRIFLGGCGTSGRLAHLESVSLNKLAQAIGLPRATRSAPAYPPFGYLLAGGDAALLLAQEAAEDKPDCGRNDLQAALAQMVESNNGGDPSDPVVVIGISCGLSATYVGSMLEYAIEVREVSKTHPNLSMAVIGFNPVDSISSVRVEGWSSSFYEVLTKMKQIQTNAEQRVILAAAAAATDGDSADIAAGPAPVAAIILNPIVGPESIAGSSRMKGGSCTKILVETIGTLAMDLVTSTTTTTSSSTSSMYYKQTTISDSDLFARIRSAFLQYEVTVRHTYTACQSIARLMVSAGKALTTPVSKIEIADIAVSRATTAATATTMSSSSPSSHPSSSFISPTGKGRILYLGVGTAGMLGLIDASECSPTYGSLFNDVRGYLGGAWSELANQEGPRTDLCVAPHMRGDKNLPSFAYPEHIKLGVMDGFCEDVVPTLGPADLVILVAIRGDNTGFNDTTTSTNTSGSSSSSNTLDENITPSAHLQNAMKGIEMAAAKGAQVRHVIISSAAAAAAAASSSSLAFIKAVKSVASEGVVIELPCCHLRIPTTTTSTAAATLPAIVAADIPGAPKQLAELALKLVLNAVTTGAHIFTGTIYQNRMINLMLTNSKLFHRAVGITARVVVGAAGGNGKGNEDKIAERAVLRAIYHLDDGDGDGDKKTVPSASSAASTASSSSIAEVATRPILGHVAAASSQHNIVPLSILLAADEMNATKNGTCTKTRALMTYQSAVDALAAEPVLRKAINKALAV